MLKSLAFRILAVGVSLLITVAFLELALRLLPVHEGTRRLPVNDESPIPRYQPNRTFTWSAGPAFHRTNTVRINNDGFVNDVDYDEHATSPLLAVIGDSYVEALQVKFSESISGRLSAEVGAGARVYSFAMSGAPLSQYLAYAAYASRAFHAGAAVISVVGNDFDESLYRYRPLPGYYYFDEDGGPPGALDRIDFAPGAIHDMARRSALARYLVSNVRVMNLPEIWRARLAGVDRTHPRYVGNTSAEMGAERMTDSKRVVRYFLDELPASIGLPAGKVMFLVDGIRPSLYDEASLKMASNSYFGAMRPYFMEQARARGYEVVDLQPLFIRHFRDHGRRFEFDRDHHWNALGHQVAFEGVKSSSLFARFIQSARSVPGAQ